ncbi:MAG: transcriptional regulator [Hyphomicrobiales bacterium]|nr:MAG: transcriptional regulator [Hyphomicrobiales bacterium]
MDVPNEVIHQSVRLRIMAALTALAPNEPGLDFGRLKKLTGATDGNLGAHIAALEKAGFIDVEKHFVDRRPRTTVTATSEGRKAFAKHVAFLKSVIGD